LRVTGKASPLLNEALAFAVEAHGAVLQERKGTRFPYVVHPIRVAEILHLFGYDDEVAVAGLLHDTIEDAGIEREQIAKRFGARVARMVEGASEPDKNAPWRERKEHTLAYLRAGADTDTLAVAATDTLDNVRSIRATIERRGEDATWSDLKTGRDDQHWYHRGLAAALLHREPNSMLFRTLDAEVRTVFPDPPRPTRLLPGKPIGTADAARPYLAQPIKHWKPAHSAYELAHAWATADGLPAEVDRVLRRVYGECELVEGLFEKEAILPTPGRPSQTDLLALLRASDRSLVVGVEAKAREPFGETVANWNDGGWGKRTRLEDLCVRLGLDSAAVGDLRYQLLHRTVATLLEAARYGVADAVMLVQSFDSRSSSLGDYRSFADALGVTDAEPSRLTSAKVLDGVTLRLGWAWSPISS
jgi:hypothetical protein